MGLLSLFGGTLFLSAALLFCVEPMVAKMLTPLLGGAPAVWITCMLFFQGALLAGYGFAHASVARLGVRRQAALQVGVVLLPLLVLPIRLREGAAASLDASSAPALTLLEVLSASVGLPFLVVSTTAPLLQRWFSRLGHPSGDDPYFLYGASNGGSLLSLAAYPVLIEPWIGLRLQSTLWTWGYASLVCCVVACAIAVLRAKGARTPAHLAADPVEAPAPLGARRRLTWLALAFVPSSFLLGVTTYITTDLAPIPLFWVAPLALYLLTFILVFAKRPPLSHALMVRLLPFALTATVLLMLVGATQPVWLVVTPHLVCFFFASMVCHGELARDRPPAAQLTEFFLWVSLGGVLGGLFNGIVAPALFRTLVEYPLVMVLAALCRRVPAAEGASARTRRWDLLAPTCVGAASLALGLGGRALGFDPSGHAFTLLFGAPLLVNYAFLSRPLRFALGVGACLAAGSAVSGQGRTLSEDRNFFGIVRVSEDPTGRFVQIIHGNTVHGLQSRDPAERRTPLGYYSRKGPLGQIFEALRAEARGAPRRVAVIGLGAGAMAAYAAPGDAWTYYEINPAVVRVAEDPRDFTYLSDAFPGGEGLSVVLGDARLRLRDANDASYDLVVLDAFSSDSIPTHLLTREALALYLEKLRPGGMLAAHISNRYLSLGPVFGALAKDAGLAIRGREEGRVAPEDAEGGRVPSTWVALARREADLGGLTRDARWVPVTRALARVWTDDYSNLLSVFLW